MWLSRQHILLAFYEEAKLPDKSANNLEEDDDTTSPSQLTEINPESSLTAAGKNCERWNEPKRHKLTGAR